MSSYQEPLSDGEADTIPIRGAGSASQGRVNRISPWTIVMGVIAAGLVLIGTLVVLKLFVAENIPDLSASALEAAQARWDESGPANYDIDLQIAGRQPGVVHLEVRNKVVTVANRDGRPTPERTWDEWSVQGQFDTLERELEMAANPQGEMNAPVGARLWLRCEFDPKFGFPRRFHRYATGGAIETSWRTTSFVPK